MYCQANNIKENQFPQLREHTELSGTSEVESEIKKKEIERGREKGSKREREGQKGRKKESRRERNELKIANRDRQIFLLLAP